MKACDHKKKGKYKNVHKREYLSTKKMDNQPNRIFFSAIKKNKLYMQIMDESFKNYVE